MVTLEWRVEAVSWSEARQGPPHTHTHFLLPGPGSRVRCSQSWLEEGTMRASRSESPMAVVHAPWNLCTEDRHLQQLWGGILSCLNASRKWIPCYIAPRNFLSNTTYCPPATWTGRSSGTLTLHFSLSMPLWAPSPSMAKISLCTHQITSKPVMNKRTDRGESVNSMDRVIAQLTVCKVQCDTISKQTTFYLNWHQLWLFPFF